jgi:hypothetical protein
MPLMGRLDFSLGGDESLMWRFGQCVVHSWAQTCTYWDGLMQYMQGLGSLLDFVLHRFEKRRSVEETRIFLQYRGFVAPAHANVNQVK